MNNMEKIQLIGLRLRALDRETDTLSYLETVAHMVRTRAQHEKDIVRIRQLINAARNAYTEEVVARSCPKSRTALSNLRANNPRLYGYHKVASVNLESIRYEIDKLEELIIEDRPSAILLFNVLVGKWSSGMTLPKAAYVHRTGDLEWSAIRIGRHIFIEGRPPHEKSSPEESDPVSFQLAVLRCFRRIAQTEIGRKLLYNLDRAAMRLHRERFSSREAMVTIEHGYGDLDWYARAESREDGHRKGQRLPTREFHEGPPKVGTGLGSPVFVSAYPNPFDEIEFGPEEDHPSNLPMPADESLFHELTHALHLLEGKADAKEIRIKSRKPQPAFRSKGAWDNIEEKVTIADENKYAKESGFLFKRLNHDRLATRIDKTMAFWRN